MRDSTTSPRVWIAAEKRQKTLNPKIRYKPVKIEILNDGKKYTAPTEEGGILSLILHGDRRTKSENILRAMIYGKR